MTKPAPKSTNFVVSMLAFLWLSCLALPLQAQTLTAPEAHRQVQAGELVLVDVRTPKEWLTTGVPRGSKLVDMKDPRFLHKLKRLESASGETPIALICDGGVRTGKLVNELEKHGFGGLLDVSEGMSGSEAGPGWLARGLPLRDYQPENPDLEAGPLSFFERMRLARLPDWDPLPEE